MAMGKLPILACMVLKNLKKRVNKDGLIRRGVVLWRMGLPNQWKREGDLPLGYRGLNALRRVN